MLSQQEIADRLGLSLRGWQKIERDEGLPSGETLIRFKTLGWNPGWVLTGVGPERISSEDGHKILKSVGSVELKNEDEIYDYMFGGRINPDLFGRIWDVIRQVYDDAKIHLPRKLEAQAAAVYYNELLNDKIDHLNDHDIQNWLDALRDQLLSELEEAKENPGTGKWSASSS